MIMEWRPYKKICFGHACNCQYTMCSNEMMVVESIANASFLLALIRLGEQVRKIKNKRITLINDLDIYDSRQFLDPVEQDVALLYDGLILRILRVWSVRHDDSTNLVDLAVEPPIGNQLAQLPIHVVLGHVESLCHVS